MGFSKKLLKMVASMEETESLLRKILKNQEAGFKNMKEDLDVLIKLSEKEATDALEKVDNSAVMRAYNTGERVYSLGDLVVRAAATIVAWNSTKHVAAWMPSTERVMPRTTVSEFAWQAGFSA